MFLYKIDFIGVWYNTYDTRRNLRAHLRASILKYVHAGYVTASKIQKEKKKGSLFQSLGFCIHML